MNLMDRRASVLRAMEADGIATLLLASNGLHLIDLPNPVAHLLGFRSLGEAVAVLKRDGTCVLLVSPAEDAERAAELTDAECIGTDDLADALSKLHVSNAAWVRLPAMPVHLASSLARAAGSDASWDRRFHQVTAGKTETEIAHARKATAVAEAGFRDLLALAGEGVRAGTLRECDLAVEVNLRMKALGANDSFLMMNCLRRAPAVMPSSERLVQRGDMLLVELSPSVGGQFVQICRTAMIGEPAPALLADYKLLTEALQDGIDAVRPGAAVSAICDAIDARTATAGYAAYSRPPHLRRRGHGLGCGSVAPGDIAFDNPTPLEPNMVFVVHPNQLLPNSGYMMCGEPMLVTETGGEVLSQERASLAVVEV